MYRLDIVFWADGDILQVNGEASRPTMKII